jgi:organic radical activating enzyme
VSYKLADIFYSLQGEGHRKGSANVFVRFAGCNLDCSVNTHGFDCDTDFDMTDSFDTAPALVHEVIRFWGGRPWDHRAVILTGGEPTLQVNDELVRALRAAHFYVAIETNGTRSVPAGVHWVSCSPKRGEDVVLRYVDELRYVVAAGDQVPDPACQAAHYFVSPAFNGDQVQPGALERCIDICRSTPPWRLSVQDHKAWGVQ